MFTVIKSARKPILNGQKWYGELRRIWRDHVLGRRELELGHVFEKRTSLCSMELMDVFEMPCDGTGLDCVLTLHAYQDLMHRLIAE